MKIDFSFRYFVMGVYLDRNKKVIRIYPIPFFRISVDRIPVYHFEMVPNNENKNS